MQRIPEDTALLQQSLCSSMENAKELAKFWEDASPEVRYLLGNECNVIYECRACRNLFRSIINFVSHKRVACRLLSDAPGPSSSEVQRYVDKAIIELDSATGTSRSGSVDPAEQPVRKPKAALRRMNIVNVVNKRAEHYSKSLPPSKNSVNLHRLQLPSITRSIPTTTFENGQQVFVTAPEALAQKEPHPTDKIPLVVPHDHSIKYREMNLRRRENDPKLAPARIAGFSERFLSDRLATYPELADAGTLSCLHSDCTEIQPFSSLYTLAYHLTARHCRLFFPKKKNFCFVCGDVLESYKATMVHLKKEHRKYYEDHQAFRAAPSEEKADIKKTKRVKSNERNGSISHSGSLSPKVVDFEEADMMPVLHRYVHHPCKRSAPDAIVNS